MLKKVKFFNSETGQWEIVAVAEKGDKGDPFTYEDFKPEQLEALRGPKGDNGVFSKSIKAIEIVPELPAEGVWDNGTLYIVVEGVVIDEEGEE